MGSFSKKLSVFLRIKITLQSKTMSFDERREYVSKLRMLCTFIGLSKPPFGKAVIRMKLGFWWTPVSSRIDALSISRTGLASAHRLINHLADSSEDLSAPRR
jgi:hypothetical protein